jgi:hypothetical protein
MANYATPKSAFDNKDIRFLYYLNQGVKTKTVSGASEQLANTAADTFIGDTKFMVGGPSLFISGGVFYITFGYKELAP